MAGNQEANPKASASITSNNFPLAKISHVSKPKNNGTFIKMSLTLSRATQEAIHFSLRSTSIHMLPFQRRKKKETLLVFFKKEGLTLS